MRILQGEAAESYVEELECRGSRLQEVEPVVRRIIEVVRAKGEAELIKYAREFDGLAPDEDVRVNDSELQRAWKNASRELKSALKQAAVNIRQFCEWQTPRDWKRSRAGISLGQIVRPLDSVGCYVPGGRFPLVSTLLMTVIPAQVAGVRSIRIVSPRPSRELLAAAAMLGVHEFYRVGGAQAIAALAYGTETIARVDKIVGPGNLYVTAAKKLVAFDCAIDMLAGPTEVVIVSSRGNPEFIAADLLAQAEHDPETLAIFITTSRKLAESVVSATQQCGSAANENARTLLSSRGAALIAGTRDEAFVWANRIAPEHLTVEKNDLPRIRNAGSVFIGDYSAQAAGDYASGPNHVLPTGGAARLRGGLSVTDFLKLISVQELSAKGLRALAPTVVSLAESEGLRAHAESIRVRCARA
jgi:histidinol dehydrogenase